MLPPEITIVPFEEDDIPPFMPGPPKRSPPPPVPLESSAAGGVDAVVRRVQLNVAAADDDVKRLQPLVAVGDADAAVRDGQRIIGVKASSPVAIAKLPPLTVMEALECTASSAESIVKSPALINIPVPALRPFMLVESSEAAFSVVPIPGRPPIKAAPRIRALLRAVFAAAAGKGMSRLPPSSCIVEPALTLPSASIRRVPPENIDVAQRRVVVVLGVDAVLAGVQRQQAVGNAHAVVGVDAVRGGVDGIRPARDDEVVPRQRRVRPAK